MNKFLCFFLVSLTSLAHTSIDPVAFRPAIAPTFTEDYAPNDFLQQSQRLSAGQWQGPEDIAIDHQGYIYSGNADGTVKRCRFDGTELEVYAHTGGHPLGLDFDAEGQLYVAEPSGGLLKIDRERRVHRLVSSFEGQAFGLIDDVKVASNGLVYFTDASSKYGLDDFKLDFLESRPNGRLFVYDPHTGSTKLLLDQLYFANGLAFSTQEDFLIIAESSRYRLRRLWLAGPRQGQDEVWLDNLPGIPDTISSNGSGTIWVAYVSIRDRMVDALLPHPHLKKLVAKLPKKWQPQPKAYGLVVGYAEDGKVLQTLQDPTGKYARYLTSVEEFQGHLIMGSLLGDAVYKVKLP